MHQTSKQKNHACTRAGHFRVCASAGGAREGGGGPGTEVWRGRAGGKDRLGDAVVGLLAELV